MLLDGVCQVLLWWDPFCVIRPKRCLCVCVLGFVCSFCLLLFRYKWFGFMRSLLFVVVLHVVVVPFLLIFCYVRQCCVCARAFVCVLFVRRCFGGTHFVLVSPRVVFV